MMKTWKKCYCVGIEIYAAHTSIQSARVYLIMFLQLCNAARQLDCCDLKSEFLQSDR